MNDIPLESAPPRLEPVFAPAPPITVRAGRFDDHLRRAESAPRNESAPRSVDPVSETQTKSADSPITTDRLAEDREGTATAKLRHRGPKRAAKTTKNPSPDVVANTLQATRTPVQPPAAKAEGTAPSAEAAAETLANAPDPPHLLFISGCDYPISQDGPFEQPSPVAVITDPSPLFAVAAPGASAESAATSDAPARFPQSINALAHRRDPSMNALLASGLAIQTQSDDTDGERAEGVIADSKPRSAANATVELSENLLKNFGDNADAAGGALHADGTLPGLEVESTQVDATAAAADSSDKTQPPETGSPAPSATDLRGSRVTGGGLAARGPSQQVETTGDPQGEVERVRFVQRVSRAFQSLGNQEGHVRLRLSPPSLGALTLEVTLRGGEMVARLETETAAAKNLLLDSLPALRERLSQHEVRIARFDVDLADHTGGGPAGRQAHGDDLPRRPSALGRPAHAGATPSAPAAPSPRRSSVTSAVSLDVLI